MLFRAFPCVTEGFPCPTEESLTPPTLWRIPGGKVEATKGGIFVPETPPPGNPARPTIGSAVAVTVALLRKASAAPMDNEKKVLRMIAFSKKLSPRV